MMLSLGFAIVAASLLVTVQCSQDTIYGPAPTPDTDRHDPANVIPSTGISLYYASNSSNSGITINHVMRYPSVVLEQIASITKVDCSSSSISVTFNDSSIFAASRDAWSAKGNFVLVTNHLGDCDPELERGVFLVKNLTCDASSLVCKAGSEKSDIPSSAASTEITFGALSGSTLASRQYIILDPAYSLTLAESLASDTVLYSYAPYLTVTADTASFTSNVTFSGYLKYDWLTFQVLDFYFDVDAAFAASFSLTAAITATYSTTLSYSPSALSYSISIPGILELGPELTFAVDALISATAAADITAGVGISLADGKLHLDVLNSSDSYVSGWTPTYSASASISGQVEAEINPSAPLTVEIAIDFFSGLLDLSIGITATPGFENTFAVTGSAAVDLTGVEGATSSGVCPEGLLLQSNFTFDITAFATEWWKDDLYNVTIPLLDKCYSWE